MFVEKQGVVSKDGGEDLASGVDNPVDHRVSH